MILPGGTIEGDCSGLRMTQLAVTMGPELLSAGRHQRADLYIRGAGKELKHPRLRLSWGLGGKAGAVPGHGLARVAQQEQTALSLLVPLRGRFNVGAGAGPQK